MVIMSTSIKVDVSVKSCASLYHAHFCKILTMCSYEYSKYLEQINENNPVVDIEEEEVTYLGQDGQLSLLQKETFEEMLTKKSEQLGSSHKYELPARGLPAGAGLNTSDVCDDFSDSLAVHIRTNIPPLEEGKIRICESLIDFIDERGFIKDDPGLLARHIGVDVEEVEEALEIIRSLEPVGIGSRNLGDFLCCQCIVLGWDTEMMKRLIFYHLDDIARNDIQNIQVELDASKRQLNALIDKIKSLRPYPTWGMELATVYHWHGNYIAQPDLSYYYISDIGYVLQVIEPSITIKPVTGFHKWSDDTGNHDLKKVSDWIEKVRILQKEAKEIIDMNTKRREAILEVAAVIVERQRGYLLKNRDYKLPLTVSQIADISGLSVSTVSRVLKDRIIATPRGTMPLKGLLSRPFPGARNSETSQDYISVKIERLLQGPDETKMTDVKIAETLKSEGVDISRRTVNKYRNMLMEQTS
jgi:RNA polymerase sigma-54 factor